MGEAYINVLGGAAFYDEEQNISVTANFNGGNFGMALPMWDNANYPTDSWNHAINGTVLTKLSDVTAGWVTPTTNPVLPFVGTGASTYNVGSEIVVGVSITSAPITVNLPGAPVGGRQVIVLDVNGTSPTHTITINGNGHNINGSASVTITTAYGAKQFIFGGIDWNIV